MFQCRVRIVQMMTNILRKLSRLRRTRGLKRTTLGWRSKKKEKKREPWLWKVACQDRIETIIDEVGDENFARALDIDMDRYLGFPVPQYGENSWLPRLADMPAFALVDPDEHPMEWRGTPARSAEGN